MVFLGLGVGDAEGLVQPDYALPVEKCLKVLLLHLWTVQRT